MLRRKALCPFLISDSCFSRDLACSGCWSVLWARCLVGALFVSVVSEVGSEVLLCAFVPAVDLPAGCGVSGGGVECGDDGVAVVDVCGCYPEAP